jgi:hypothetical protein
MAQVMHGGIPLRTPLSLLLCVVIIIACFTVPSEAHTLEWQGEQIIDEGEKNAEAPLVAMDSYGNAIAVWSQDIGGSNYGQYRLHACRFTPGDGWSAPQLIQNSNSNVFHFAFSMSANGDAMVVSVQYDRTIVVRPYSLGLGWGVEQMIYVTDDLNTYLGEVKVDMDSQGVTLAVWTEHKDASWTIKAMTYSKDDGWGPVQTVQETSIDISMMQMDFSESGTAIATWEMKSGNFSHDVYARTFNGTVWSSLQDISFSNNYSASPQVVIDNDGNAIVVWIERLDGNESFNTYSNRYSPDSGWETARSIQDGTNNSMPPRLVRDNEGNAIAVWQQFFGGGDYNLVTNQYSFETGWGDAIRIDDKDWSGALPQIAMDALGDVIIIWVPEGPSTLISIRYVDGVGWDDVEGVQSSAGISDSQCVVMDPVGNTIVVWRQNGDIHANYMPAELRLFVDEPISGSVVNETMVKVTGRTNPGAILEINGLNVHVNDNGGFAVNISLAEGLNQITINASTAYDAESITITVEFNDSHGQEPLDSDEDGLGGLNALALAIGIIGIAIGAIALTILVKKGKRG